MRWLLHGKTKTRPVKGGEIFEQVCPECGKKALFYEVEVTTSAGAFFVDLLSSTERAFICSKCEEVFDVKDDKDTAALPAGQPPPRDLLSELEKDKAKRGALAAAKAQKVEDELAELKRKMGK
jgi:DNA-directed RNA polymerase subunit RPC12/RpoP